MKKKRGQFYLVAAMIIIAVLVAVFSITNFVSKSKTNNELKILEEELNMEIIKNFEYIGINNLDLSASNIIWENFADAQISNLKSNKDVVFIWGDEDYLVSGGQIIIKEETNEYIFDFKKGQHFYYLISKEYKGERTIIKG